MLRPQPRHNVAEPRRRPRPSPPAPLSPSPACTGTPPAAPAHPPLERPERCRDRFPLILRRGIRRQSPGNRRPADTKIPGDLPLRNPVRHQPPDQRPILHRDHPSNLSGWPHFRAASTVAAATSMFVGCPSPCRMPWRPLPRRSADNHKIRLKASLDRRATVTALAKKSSNGTPSPWHGGVLREAHIGLVPAPLARWCWLPRRLLAASSMASLSTLGLRCRLTVLT
jgi:hypothetical protein